MAKIYQIKVTDTVAEKLEKIAQQENLSVEELFVMCVKEAERNKKLKEKLIKMIKDL